MNTTMVALTFAFLLSCLVAKYLSSPNALLHLLDTPNERSLHDSPTPRSGGIAVVLGTMVGIVSSMYMGEVVISGTLVTCALVISLTGLIDDYRSLSALLRLLVQFAVGAIVVASGVYLTGELVPGLQWHPSGLLAWVVSVIFLVWMINLYNFMDGMDGFASGMSVVGFAVMGLLAMQSDAGSFSILAFVLAAAALGFLTSNFPPAKLFLGDNGSSFLGFCAGGMALWASKEHYFPIWISVLVFSPFIIDATLTLLCRVLAGERFWEAHRSHCYQRLVLAGWTHRRTVICSYLIMLGCGATALWVHGSSVPVQLFALLGWALVYGTIFLAVKRRKVSPP